MNGILRNIGLFLVATAAFVTTGCNETPETPEPPKPEVKISDVKATYQSVTFTLTAANAAKYTYEVALKGAAGTPVTVENKATSTETVSGLTPEKDYVITAIAYSTEGVKSIAATHEFATNPRAKIAIAAEIETTSTTATLTLTPTNATKMSYIYYKKDNKPETPAWNVIEGNDAQSVVIKDLSANTEYLLEAYAANDEGDGDIVTSNVFKTGDVFSVRFSSTKTFVAAYVDFDKAQCHGYISSGMLIDVSSEYVPYRNVEEFLKLIEGQPGAFVPVKEPGWASGLAGFGNADNTYSYFTVMVDDKGKVLPETAKEWVVTMPAENQIGSGAATVVLSDIVSTARRIDLKAKFSANTAIYAAGAVSKANMEGKTIQDYVTTQMNDGMLALDVISMVPEEGKLSFEMLSPSTEYVIFVIAVDKNGKFGTIVSQTSTTPEMSYRSDVTVALTIDKALFSQVNFKVTMQNAASVRQTYLTLEAFETNFNSDQNAVIANSLFDEWAETIMTDDKGIWVRGYLDGAKKYVLFTLPVAENGDYGNPVVMPFETPSYDGAGVATVTLEKTNSGVEYDTPFAVYTITPDATCTDYMYAVISDEVYKQNSKTLGRYLATNASICTTISPAVNTPDVRVDAYSGEDNYLVVIARDKDAKWSKVVMEKVAGAAPASNAVPRR